MSQTGFYHIRLHNQQSLAFPLECPPFRKRQTWRVFLLAVSGFTSAHIWDLRFAGGSLGLPCLFSFIRSVQNYVSMKKNSIINKRNSSKRQYFLSKVELWCFRRKNLTNKQLHLDSDLAVQSWTSNRKPDGKVLVTWLLDVRGSREMPEGLYYRLSYKKLTSNELLILSS